MYTLKQAVEDESFEFIVDSQPGCHKNAIGIPAPIVHKWAQLLTKNRLACVSNSWTCARAAAKELALAFEADQTKVDDYATYLLAKWLERLDGNLRGLI